jgi:hypothetical protein
MFKHLSYCDTRAPMLAWTNFVPSPFSQETSVSGGSGHPAQTLLLAPSNFHLFWTPEGAPGWYTICHWQRCASCCHFLAKDAEQQFLPHWDRCLGVMVGQMLKHLWWLCRKVFFHVRHNKVLHIGVILISFFLNTLLRYHSVKQKKNKQEKHFPDNVSRQTW